MKVIKSEIPDVLIIELDVFHDNRGFFVERFNQQKFEDLSLPISFVQDNHSFSKPGVIRGLHYQENPSQGKLVGCLSGKIQDVAVDIREDSRTFGKYVSIELSAEHGKLLWIPQGFAHGFCVLGNEPAHVVYKVENMYSASGDRGIIWNDPDLNIEWDTKTPVLSEKDLKLGRLNSISYFTR